MKKVRFAMVVGVLVLVGGTLCFPNQSVSQPTRKPIVWGCPISLGMSGGRDSWKALKFAVDEMNKEGGIRLPDGKHPIQLEVMDSRDLEPGVPVAEALLCMERLILEKKADFIIGGLHRSEAGMAAMDMSGRYKKVLVLASGNESPRIPAKIASDREKYRYVWLTTTTSDKLVPLYVPLFDTFKDKWNFKKFYVIVQDTTWARGWGNVFEKILTQKGWEKQGNQAFPLGSSDFSSAVLDAKRNASDVILGCFDAMESAILMKQWATLKVPALPVAHISPAQCLKFWDATEGRCEYAILDGLGTTSPRISRWAERYMKWCEKEDAADGDPIHNYCGAYCLKEAIEIAGSLDPDAVSKAFLKVDIKDSPMGRLKFDPERHQWILSDDPTKGAVVGWFQWQAGKRVYVFPEKIATGDLKIPPWRK